MNCKMLLLKIYCGCCGKIFFICGCCFRGQKYCCDECRIAGYRQVHLEAQKKYRLTDKGKKQHSESEKRRRLRKKQKGKLTTAMHKICMCLAMILKSLFYDEDDGKKTGHCQICGTKGKIVHEFPSRGYGHVCQISKVETDNGAFTLG